MSEQVYQPDHKPFFNDSVLTYIGVLGAVVIAIAVFLGSIAASTPGEAEGVTEALKQQRVAKREEVNGAGRKLISEYGKNANGTFRIPAEEAAKILVNNPAALDASRGVSK
jgi:hypothetical protein